jgi:hypothetical protein
MTDDRFDAARDWLASHETAMVTHPGGTLLDHLNRVARRLQSWGHSPEIALAALTLANEIDVMTHNAELADRHGTALHDLAIAADHWLTDAARPDIPLLRGLP